MTTQASGGKITGILALTLQAQSALNDGDPVHIVGDYECDVADGTKPIVGFVSVRNVRRGSTLTGANPNAGFYPVANVPGDVTVEARGFMVLTLTASAAVAAGAMVGISGARTVVSWTGATPAATTPVGIALEPASGAGVTFDVLVGPSA
jgi:hypothetical protein